MKWGWYWTTGTSASRHFSFRQPCLSTSVPPVCSFWTYVVPCSWTCWSMEAGSTWIWRPGAGDPSVRRYTGLTRACAGCWWAGRREMGRFQWHPAEGRQERQGRGEREREGPDDDARATSHANTSWFMPSYQRPATPSCTSASRSAPSSSRSPPSWRSWRPSAGAAENTPIRVFLPTSSRRTLRTAPYLGLPMDSRHGTARSRCFQPPSTSRSSCTALRAKRADRWDRGG